MELHETLRSLKAVQPDPEYTRASRRMLMGMVAASSTKAQPIAQWLQSLRMLGVATAGILALIGGVTVARTFTTSTPLASLDTRTLEAETSAVNAQMALAELEHSVAAQAAATETPQEPVYAAAPAATQLAAASDRSVAIDNALDELAY